MYTVFFIGQLVDYLNNETHTTVNYIHMVIGVISLGYVTRFIIHHPHSTANNALNLKAYNYPLKHCCTL